MGEVLLFQDAESNARVSVLLDGETVWLTQQQMAELFDTDRSNVVKHLQNIYDDGELRQESTCAIFAQVRMEGVREVSRRVPHYNLDAILSVGYRVNSKQGVRFRQWATKTLNEHLVLGYTINQRRLSERGIAVMQQAVTLLARAATTPQVLTDESRQVLDLIVGYAKTWQTLLRYDENNLGVSATSPSVRPLGYAAAKTDVEQLKSVLLAKGEATELFGRERGETFAGVVTGIEQTMFGQPLYEGAESKAAHLFYFTIKDHPFVDGNKRIGSFLLMRYLQKQGLSLSLSPEALAALALLVAESDPAQKDLMVGLTTYSITAHLRPEPTAESKDDSDRTHGM